MGFVRVMLAAGSHGGWKKMKYDVISADCHVDLIWLPPDLFTESASQAFKERMP